VTEYNLLAVTVKVVSNQFIKHIVYIFSADYQKLLYYDRTEY